MQLWWRGVMRFFIRAWQRIQLAILFSFFLYNYNLQNPSMEHKSGITEVSIEGRGNAVCSGLQPNEPLQIQTQRWWMHVLWKHRCVLWHITVFMFCKSCPWNKAGAWMNGFTVQPKLWQVATHECARLKHGKGFQASGQDSCMSWTSVEMTRFPTCLCFSCS